MNPSMKTFPPFSFPERTPTLDMVRAVNSETLQMGIGVKHPEMKTDSPSTDPKRTPKDLERAVNYETLEIGGVEDEHLEMKRDSLSTDQDVSPQAPSERGGMRMMVLPAGSTGTGSPLQQPRGYPKVLAKSVGASMERHVSGRSSVPTNLWTLSKSALQHFSQEKGAELDLVEIGHSSLFAYAYYCFHHINFKARPQNLGVAEPSVKLFFAEVMTAYRKPTIITCCRVIEPTNKVTEGCRFCYRGSLVIHPICDVIEIDRKFSTRQNIVDGKFPDLAMCLPGIPPWQLNHPDCVQPYDAFDPGYYESDEGVPGVLSLEEYLDYRKTRAQQLSEAVLKDLINNKDMDLKLVQGSEYSTFKYREHTFHHLNFEAKPQWPLLELSPRLYFAEVINDGGAYRTTFCCIVDLTDKVVERCRYCGDRPIIQPDISWMDLDPMKPGNVLYVDLTVAQDLQVDRTLAQHKFHGLPYMLP